MYRTTDDGKFITIEGDGADFEAVRALLSKASGGRAGSGGGRIIYRANRGERATFGRYLAEFEKAQTARLDKPTQHPTYRAREMHLADSPVAPRPQIHLTDVTTVRFTGWGRVFICTDDLAEPYFQGMAVRYAYYA